MKKTILCVLLAWLPAASAIEIKLAANGDPNQDEVLYLGLSGTGSVSVWLNIGADDGNVAFMNAFFDTHFLGRRGTSGYDVVGRQFTMERDNDPGGAWFRAFEWDGDRNIENYALIAADDDRNFPRELSGTDGPWQGFVDHIIIQPTLIGVYDLYFENSYTVDRGHAARPPQLFDRNLMGHSYAINLDIPGFIHFSNAWKDDNADFDKPFMVSVFPEPSSLTLLALGSLALLRRRR